MIKFIVSLIERSINQERIIGKEYSNETLVYQ